MVLKIQRIPILNDATQPVTRKHWAIIAGLAKRLNQLFGYKIRELDDLDVYAWQRAVEAKKHEGRKL